MVIGALDYCNGITSYAMNYYNHLNRDFFDIDFAVHYNYDSDYKPQILLNGNKDYYMGDYSIKSMLSLNKRINKLLEENHYDIIHCHILNVAYFYFKVAKKHNVKIRILHSHATKNSDNPVKNIRNNLLKLFGLKYTTDYFACSKIAGTYLFKNKKFVVIKNAVDYDRFYFDYNKRIEIRKKYNILDDEILFGFVGRFTTQKNIYFLLCFFKELINKNSKFKLILIGDGLEKGKIEKYIESNKIKNFVTIIESTTDIASYYNAFDALLLPSLFEGLPVTGIEAQVSGLPVICSDKITQELNFNELCTYLSIDSIDKWVSYLLSFSPNTNRNYVSMDYSIEQQSKFLADIYSNLVEKRYEK